jgi:hypothetical protein
VISKYKNIPVGAENDMPRQLSNRHSVGGLLQLDSLLVDKVAALVSNHVRIEGAILAFAIECRPNNTSVRKARRDAPRKKTTYARQRRGRVKAAKPPWTGTEVTCRQPLHETLSLLARELSTEADMTIPGIRTSFEMAPA